MLRLNKTIAFIIILFSVISLKAMKAPQEVSWLSPKAKLFLAIQYDSLEEVQEALMEDHDCVNAIDDLGNTPLILATIKENPCIVEILLANNADPLFTTPYGQKALDMAHHLYGLKFFWRKGFMQRYGTLVHKKEKTAADIPEMSKLLEEIDRMTSSLNNLEAIIQQFNNTPQDPDQPGA